MKSELWELKHNLLGIEVTVYDLCVILLDLGLVLAALVCFLVSFCKGRSVLTGNYSFNPLSQKDSIGKTFYGNSKYIQKKSRRNGKEELVCSICKMNLQLYNPF
mgnify:CR=1 FL=1